MVHDIAHYLLGGGHEVHIIASKPGGGSVQRDGRLTIHRLPQVNHPVWQRYRLVPRFDTHGIMTIPLLLRERFDLIHAFMYVYGPGILLSRWLCGTPCVYHAVMIPPTWGRTFDGPLFSMSSRAAKAFRVFSRFGATRVQEEYGITAHVVPPTVDLETFQPRGPKNLSRPRILYTADLVQLAKGPHVMVAAFNEVHRARPQAILQLAGPVGAYPPAVKGLLALLEPAAREAVEVLGPGALHDLPMLYSCAAVTVLPSLNEPFGMVLTESLASGTVVVGTNSGAIPEIISDSSVGALFERTDDVSASARRLADAILQALDLASDPTAIDRCRNHARQWSWEAVRPTFDRLQAAASGGAPVGRLSAHAG
jgi:glycosyltransferase involved in cell wall biosynthesis